MEPGKFYWCEWNGFPLSTLQGTLDWEREGIWNDFLSSSDFFVGTFRNSTTVFRIRELRKGILSLFLAGIVFQRYEDVLIIPSQVYLRYLKGCHFNKGRRRRNLPSLFRFWSQAGEIGLIADMEISKNVFFLSFLEFFIFSPLLPFWRILVIPLRGQWRGFSAQRLLFSGLVSTWIYTSLMNMCQFIGAWNGACDLTQFCRYLEQLYALQFQHIRFIQKYNQNIKV